MLIRRRSHRPPPSSLLSAPLPRLIEWQQLFFFLQSSATQHSSHGEASILARSNTIVTASFYRCIAGGDRQDVGDRRRLRGPAGAILQRQEANGSHLNQGRQISALARLPQGQRYASVQVVRSSSSTFSNINDRSCETVRLPPMLRKKTTLADSPRRHIDSYNFFVEHEIKDIVRANRTIRSDVDSNFWLE